ncbi:MAG TPA: Rap1a/Tai family immunity protein [Beijerinckiaceae bacterium]|nr:Rap1a/Tai family immunity protein [Beijerinckiaceae bacterium]
MMRTLLIAAVLASLGAARAQAQVSGFVDGNDLHKLCISNSHGAIIYILGVSDAHDFFVARGVSARICPPERFQRGQVADVACKYLADNPQDRHLSAASLVIFDLEGDFPCRR